MPRPARPLLMLVAILSLGTDALAHGRPTIDVARDAAAAEPGRRVSTPEAARLEREYVVRSMDDRYDVPSFVWAPRRPARDNAAARAQGGVSADARGRSHLAGLAPLYRLGRADLDGIRLRHVHDTGRGMVVASYAQQVDGIEVFRDEFRVGMSRDLELIAVSGHLAPRSLAVTRGSAAFRLRPERALSLALRDFTEDDRDRAVIARGHADQAGFDRYAPPGDLATRGDGRAVQGDLRLRRVWFRLPDSLEPAYHIEVLGEDEGYTYVVSAQDGRILFRNSLIADVAFSYRVWADGPAGGFRPFDGPQGAGPSPHPTGLVDFYNPALLAPSLVTVEHSSNTMSDPWLPPGATETVGNNVDAYVDLVSPDGLSAGDFRAPLTGPLSFDHVYNTALAPNANATQRNAATTTLFYVNNYLHNAFYDAGFDEASGNAQANNFGRGGAEVDVLLAQGQDYGGTNNANMSTPADGASPRMQMYVFSVNSGRITIQSPPAIAGAHLAGVAVAMGPQTYSVVGNVVQALDAVAPVGDGCSALTNAAAVNGKIALVDRGCPSFATAAINAQNAGAIALIVVNNTLVPTPPNISTSSGIITIPVVLVSQAVGNSIKAQLGGGVSVQLSRSANVTRDGTIDGHIIAHEWGHYLSNRLIGNASGISTNQAAGMGEGWSDFIALLMSVRPSEVPADYSGVYNIGPYALSGSGTANHAYYFGIRRFPYSTDMTKAPLTYRYIVNGQALPLGIPYNSNGDPAGGNNSQVHRTGEVWCNMLWECYAALLRDTGRLTFAQANQRMRDYLVAGLKLTPDAPTFLDARDALLAATIARDPVDFALFAQAFAKRGLGTGAVAGSPTDNAGAVESFVLGGDLRVVSLTLTDDDISCDNDSYVDNNERGTLRIEIQNVGATALAGVSADVSTTSSSLFFPTGSNHPMPASQPFDVVSVDVPVDVIGAGGMELATIDVGVNSAGLLVPGPRVASFTDRVNVDEVPSALDEVEAHSTTWTLSAGPGAGGGPWRRVQSTPGDREWFVEDVGGVTDLRLESPAFVADLANPLTITFQHRYSFEWDASFNYDGGVVELSTDGVNWVDVGASLVPGYGGVLGGGSGNPLEGRSAFVRQSAGYPAMVPTTLALGNTYAGQTVRIRFRHAADLGVGAPGWWIDDIQVNGATTPPFVAPIDEQSACNPLAVEGTLPTALEFAVSGRHPSYGVARLGFALPKAGSVRVTLHDLSGRLVATVADGDYAAGRHEVAFSRHADGSPVRAGMYFARMRAAGQERTLRLIMVR